MHRDSSRISFPLKTRLSRSFTLYRVLIVAGGNRELILPCRLEGHARPTISFYPGCCIYLLPLAMNIVLPTGCRFALCATTLRTPHTALKSIHERIQKRYKHVMIGETAQTKKRFGAEEVSTFAELSTDTNPLHLDPEYAATTRFRRPVVHGILTASLLSAVVGNKLPGNGSIYMSQVFNFKKPVFVGDEVIAKVIVKKIQKERKVITLDTICSVMRQKTDKEGKTIEEEEIVIDGESVIYYPLLE